MKRFWIGILLLALMLGSGIWITVASARCNEEISALLADSGQSALTGQWQQASHCYTEALAKWESKHRSNATMTDHEPMEEIDSLFAEARVYLQSKDPAAFSACCASLSVFIKAIGDAQSVHWWSLL
jgi:hypothetical protein